MPICELAVCEIKTSVFTCLHMLDNNTVLDNLYKYICFYWQMMDIIYHI